MKIAVSGAVSTGKTTLAKALADGLDLPFIAENMDTLFGVGQKTRKSLRSSRPTWSNASS